ncbi:MAG: pilin [Parcubacteria group bacterium]
MKQFPKILKIFFLTFFLFELLGFGLILTTGKTALAADPIKLKMQVGIPGAETGFGPNETYTFTTKDTKPIAQYIRSIYKYAIGIVGILATVVMMIGGIMWIMSGGSPERAGEAKAYISASLTGLVLTLASYLILATVNPALTNFKISEIKPVGAPPESAKETINTTYEKKADGSYQCCNPPNIVPTSQIIDTVYVAPTTYSSGCGSGFYCNNEISPTLVGADPCAGQGYCSQKLGDNSPCSNTLNCQDGFQCLDGRCKAATVVNAIGKTCQLDGTCPVPLRCAGRKTASGVSGLCFEGKKNDPCCSDSECLSNSCTASFFSVCRIQDGQYRCN